VCCRDCVETNGGPKIRWGGGGRPSTPSSAVRAGRCVVVEQSEGGGRHMPRQQNHTCHTRLPDQLCCDALLPLPVTTKSTPSGATASTAPGKGCGSGSFRVASRPLPARGPYQDGHRHCGQPVQSLAGRRIDEECLMTRACNGLTLCSPPVSLRPATNIWQRRLPRCWAGQWGSSMQ
jgi:hypothetical protein